MPETALHRPDPRFRSVRFALGRLCTRGVKLYWIYDVAEPLLDLECVKQVAATKTGDPEAAPRALIEILDEVVSAMRRPTYRVILETVLGLDPKYLDLKAETRRAIAGERFRVDGARVSSGTIRKYHEPKALDLLATSLLQYNAKIVERHSGESSGQTLAEALVGRVSRDGKRQGRAVRERHEVG